MSAPIRDVPPTERRDAALRFLARTQEVSGAWAGDPGATALAALAFALAGHTAQVGDFRPQLARTLAWLRALSTPEPIVALADLALSGAPVDRAVALRAAQDLGADAATLAADQRLGGDADGAVLRGDATHRRPTAETLSLTAALAILM